MKIGITGSLVLYKNRKTQLRRLLRSLPLDYMMLSVFDNSEDDSLKEIFSGNENIKYEHSEENIGFGRGHNRAFERVAHKSKFHFVLNPDVYFDKGVVQKLVDFLEANESIGVVAPKILYPNGNLQYSCRLLPNPIDLFIRRIPFKNLRERRENKNELRFTGYQKECDVPFLLGCFMVFRSDVFKSIGGFDERYFMYVEDIDICREVKKTHRVVFNPNIEIYHTYARSSRKCITAFMIHLKSAISYFNKWGWFCDRDRKEINKHTLYKLQYNNYI